jgi:molybdopterin-binding protein
VGFEPTTKGLKVPCSATELPARGRSVADEAAAETRPVDRRDAARAVAPTIAPMAVPSDQVRIGRAAEMLGVTVDTIRRWADAGRLTVTRSDGGQRLVPIEEVTRMIAERRQATTDRPIVAQSARNRFAGIVTRIEKDKVAAVVEVLAGPHRLVSLMTAEAVTEMGLKVGDEAICVVKSTNVVVEIPSPREARG